MDRKPPRNVTPSYSLLMTEAGTTCGSRWMVAHRPEVFAGCSEAISEVGGILCHGEVVEKRLYFIEAAQKGSPLDALNCTQGRCRTWTP
jgi:hypothetical protein